MTAAERIAERLDRAIDDRRLLDHAFYKAWADGTLTTEDLRHYSTQYWRQVEAFPSYLRKLAGRIEDEAARTTIEANLADEVDGDHAGLWLDFAAAMGATEPEVRASTVESETAECINAFAEGTGERSPAFGLGMIYGYESQTPAVAETKVKGLREHYAIDGPGLTYFELHGELDVEHSRELTEALAGVLTDEDSLAEAEAGARAGAAAVWGLLDGVARVRALV
ncbi:MAG TPA: iron-containing redox enzyme family protein [Actinomycetota bacterium]|nr:iron-containing redox enzyme family protein [Actinomycetota bacterium]